MLSKYVRCASELVFMRATSLRDTLTFSHYQNGSNPSCCLPRGTYRCGGCSHCPWVTEGRGIHLSNCTNHGIMWIAKPGVSFIWWHVNAMLFISAKPNWKFDQRIRDHIYYSGNGKVITPVTRRIGLHQKFENTSASFVLEIISAYLKGGDWDNHILRSKTLWIEKLSATISPGISLVILNLCSLSLDNATVSVFNEVLVSPLVKCPWCQSLESLL